jgi:hypothetical protein
LNRRIFHLLFIWAQLKRCYPEINIVDNSAIKLVPIKHHDGNEYHWDKQYIDHTVHEHIIQYAPNCAELLQKCQYCESNLPHQFCPSQPDIGSADSVTPQVESLKLDDIDEMVNTDESSAVQLDTDDILVKNTININKLCLDDDIDNSCR